MSNNLSLQNVVLFGVGAMGREYSKVLNQLGVKFSVIGRSEEGVQKFFSDTGIKALSGGVMGWKNHGNTKIQSAILAVSLEELSQAAIDLMGCGVQNILMEKPGGINIEEISRVKNKADATGAKVWVAYNRRFYASVLRAQEIIDEDGGVKSFHFEFTEWPHIVLDQIKSEVVKKNWFLANSTHVVDIAFLLGGVPKKLKSFTAGGSPWYPTATIFAGSGVSEIGALFSYQANWLAPGRWAIEVLTINNRLIFRPLEKLQVQRSKSTAIDFLEIDDRLDKEFKPGLYKQTELFLQGSNHNNFLKIDKHLENAIRHFQIIERPN